MLNKQPLPRSLWWWYAYTATGALLRKNRAPANYTKKFVLPTAQNLKLSVSVCNPSAKKLRKESGLQRFQPALFQVYIFSLFHDWDHQQKLSGGPGTVLAKRTLFKKMSFSLQRNAHFDEQNLALFLRENSAKFAFREGFLGISVGHFFFPFQTRRFSVEIVFCWRRVCPLTYRHCQHLTYRRKSLLFEHHELGMKSLTAAHAASMVPAWELIFSLLR